MRSGGTSSDWMQGLFSPAVKVRSVPFEGCGSTLNFYNLHMAFAGTAVLKVRVVDL